MANENLNKEERRKISEMEIFLKAAFCIDGSCDYIEDVIINSNLKITTNAMFALGDSKRGIFYITISK